MLFTAAFYFWRLGDRWAAKKTPALSRQSRPPSPTHHASRITPSSPFALLSQAGALNSPPATDSLTNHASRVTNHFALRLSNTTAPIGQLQRSDHALLLENALLDTAQPAPPIPDHLRAQGDPGSYLVQARGPIDNAFRSLLQAAGASIVSYIPNNAYLVRASAVVARQLQAAPQTLAVLPYEPYYKLKPSLLKLAVAQEPLPDNAVLNVLLFADARDTTRAALQELGATVLGDEERSPFGPVLKVVPPADGLPDLAGLPGVQEVEWALTRALANDFSRVRIGVAPAVLATNNYLGLSGSNVLVNINDSGVDATHPDLTPRVSAGSTNALVDPNGHGTHVAGIIASSGGQSSTVTNASGPNGPYVGIGTQFRGMAPNASLFALPVGLLPGPWPLSVGSAEYWPSDGYLQETAAQTNAFISNNSWNYVGADASSYDLHAASYDAAVRDALPNVPGSQPLLLVFSAGDNGGGSDDGTGGNADTILSPATAKNVITVGAIEQLRNITNKVVNASGVTNQPWLAMTDSSNQVASFSSRGPVGVGIEGTSGRFKPDLVAPGTFVISTRSGQWDTNAYYNPTSQIYTVYSPVVILTNLMYLNSIFVPANAVQLNLSVVPNTNSPVPFPDLLIYVEETGYPTSADQPLGTNSVSLPPDAALSPVGAFWYYGISNRTAQPVVCDLVTDIVVTNALGNYLPVLEGMNDSLGGFYRYESGTSMAAADVSGTLALMQEFFQQRLGLTNSPALMKALLINGARSVGNLYDFDTTATLNRQGWGVINLPTTLPGSLTNLSAATNSMAMLDQDPANALATGQSRTYKVSLSSDAQSQPLRVTLVWTDPPGNPVASVKLVNDLDLIVTNLDYTNLVYFGNDITSGNDFNLPWNTNTPPNVDTVNNVENVFLSPALGIGSALSTNYSITVVGSRVNVNAVTAQTNNVCQDYALVISSGDGLVTNALFFTTNAPIVSTMQPLVTIVTNSFVSSPDYVGGILYDQRVGASPQLLGTNTITITNDADAVLTLGVTNQWHFYAITNNTAFTNAAFLTFLPMNLAVPRMGVFESSADLATRPEADIDLFVAPPSIANNFALTNLDLAVVAAADKSLLRGGTETIVYSNATPGVYYIGVQSEDQQAAQYAFLGVFSLLPFSQNDSNGVHMVGIPMYQPIPDGSPQFPGVANIVALNIDGILVRRVIVTNVINHELMSDLIGNLSHGTISAVLNNHTCVIDQTGGCETWTSYIYDDSSEHNVGIDPSLINPVVRPTDGPGSLNSFGGLDGKGQWLLTMEDNALNHIGTNVMLGVFLERQPSLLGNGIIVTIQGNSCRDDFIVVPRNAISLTIEEAVVSATGPVDFSIALCAPNGGACKSIQVTNALGGSVTVGQTDLPPLQTGTYMVRTCNLTPTPITLNIRAIFGFSQSTIIPVLTTNTLVPVPILDDAVTDIYLTNDSHGLIASLNVGLLIQDPRISDLAITLISPNGTRVLLFENRGAGSINGLGTFDLSTNYLMVPFYTNNFDLAPVGLYAPGAAFQGWNVLSNFVDVMDDYTCLCLSNHILALLDGAVTNTLPTTNSLPPTNSIPYTLSFKVNHLPWLEGMVTWWPLDVDGSDIFGGFDGLLLGDVAFSTGQTNAFFDDFAGPGLNAMWQPALPNAGSGGSALPVETYTGAPNYTFGLLGTNTILRLSNTLNPLERRGWSSAATFNGQSFSYEVRFNTLNQGPGISIDGFIEIWILDAANSNRFDVLSPFGGDYGTNPVLFAGSSIDGSYNTLPFNFQTNTWYRLVLSAVPDQGVRAAVFNDNGLELTGLSFLHTAADFPSGYKIGLSQFMGTAGPGPVDVAVDFAQLTSGLAGKVNQAFYGDGLATRMIVPRCPELDLGLGRGFSIEGWINPTMQATNPAADTIYVSNSGDNTIEKFKAGVSSVFANTGLSFPEGLALDGAGNLYVANRGNNTIMKFTPGGVGSLFANTGLDGPQGLAFDSAGNLYVANISGNTIMKFTPGGVGSLFATVRVPSGLAFDTAGNLFATTGAFSGPGSQITKYTPSGVGSLFAIPGNAPGGLAFDAAGNLYVGNGDDNTIGEFTPAGVGSIFASTGMNGPEGVAFDGAGNLYVVNNHNNTVEVFTPGGVGSLFASSGLNVPTFIASTRIKSAVPSAPLVEWYDASATNGMQQGVQFWFSGLPGSNAIPGSLWVNLWDTNSDIHIITLSTNAITNGGWQHVAFTYDAATLTARLYTNGQLGAAQVVSLTNFLPRTSGDFFLGYHPDTLGNTVSFAGGLDEFSVYDRALSPCEVNAIFNAGSRGKYGTNVLVCPVATEVTLLTTTGPQIYTFTNGLAWTNNGPYWETNTLLFSTYTNPTPVIVRGLNPYNPADSNAPNNLNVVVDDFVLSELVPQTVNGLLYFTEDTNLATLPIKFAPTPFTPSNFPPVLIFSNDFVNATAGVYQAGATILGGTNSPALGPRNWTVANGPVTVVSNALLDLVMTNWLAMATGAVQCLLPTSPGLRYQFTCNLRGPCAVGWWNGSVDPLSQRAQDLISGNNGAFFNGATNTTAAFVGDINQVFVGPAGFYFNGQTEPPPAQDPDIWPEDTDDPSSQIELADPPQLQFTNAFTIEGWFKPIFITNLTYCGTELLFFRGYPEPLDCRGLGDPYWLALEPTTNLTTYDLHFHIADAHTGTLGADVFTTNAPIQNGGGSNGGWWHIAAVFDKPFTNITVVANGTNLVTITTNALRLYLNGDCIATNYTTLSPCQDLDPALNPGDTIGERCGYDWTQPFRGFMDELTLYARALTDPEIAAIAAAGTAGKADPSMPPAQSLAELSVSVDGVQLGVAYGDNSQWSTYTVTFTALDTNALVTLQSLLPGTLVDGITLTEVASDLYYLPEVPLSDLYGKDAYGVWTLEIMDDRAGPAASTNIAQLVQWQLNFSLAPSNPPPVITLSHGIPYTNSLPAYGIQYFVVPVPQWATLATNILEFADQVQTTNPLPISVLFNQTNYPTLANPALIGPLVPVGVTTLSTNGTPPLVIGQPYYLAVTNPNPVGVTFALGVWFDITTLANCQMTTNAVGAAGIPRYFQFDVPTNGQPVGSPAQSVSFWLSGAQSNLTLVLSEHLPLPDLNHYDYVSQPPRTNNEIVMLVTNTTPFPIQTNRWYVGVFNTTATNVAFALQACLSTAYPTLILLTNGIPFVVSATNSPFAAPPGPPQQLFFYVIVTNAVPGILFELYNLSGDADLLLQQDGPPTMAPYFDTSSFTGATPQQIVLRTTPGPANSQVADLRGEWFLGVYNNEQVNVAYTIRAVLPDRGGLLVSAQPFQFTLTPLNPPQGLLLSWPSVVGERYLVQYTTSLAEPIAWSDVGFVIATTPFTTLPVPSGNGPYRIVQVLSFLPTLNIQFWPPNQVRLSWSTAYPGFTLQSKLGLWSGPWAIPGLPVSVVGNDFVAYDTIGPVQNYYRLFK
jgi:sugar lactone lactonase YvrE/subtilisin-like proprotein convertase family protein